MNSLAKPILFTSENVSAILDNRKTQTRRVIKPQPEWNDKHGLVVPGWSWRYGQNPPCMDGWPDIDTFSKKLAEYCPYGQPDDLLWVRETFLPDPPIDGTWDNYLYNDGSGRLKLDAIPDRYRNSEHCIYKATWSGAGLKWRPSIFMPRWASRITLRVANVRVERVGDISEDDAKAEGVSKDCSNGWVSCHSHKHLFSQLWNSINAKRGYEWAANPWVWVVEFSQIKD